MPRTTSRPDLNGSVAQGRRLAAIKRCPPVCILCVEEIDTTLDGNHPRGATREHIIPVSRGGHPTDPANEALSHRECNVRRGTMSIEDYRRKHNIGQTADRHSRDWT